MQETTPLKLPWRPAILSPTESFRLMAMCTLDHLDDAWRQIVAFRLPFRAWIHKSREYIQSADHMRAQDFAPPGR